MIHHAATLIRKMGVMRFLAETLALGLWIAVPWALLAVLVGEN